MTHEEIATKILGEHTEREGEVVSLVLDFVAKNPDWNKEEKPTFDQRIFATMDEGLKALFNKSMEKALTKSRDRELVDMRYMLYLYLRETYGISYPKIARLFHCNHTTVLYGVKTAQSLLYYNAPFRENYQAFKNFCTK